MTTKTLEDLQVEKDALIDKAKANINSNVDMYKQYLADQTAKENAGALNSYNNYQAAPGMSSSIARTAYLNRLASANTANQFSQRQSDLNKNIYNAYLSADSLNADSQNSLQKYQDAVNKANMEYQKSRDAETDRRWQAEYDLAYEQYQKALAEARAAASRRYYGSYGSGGSDDLVITGNDNGPGLDRYAMSLYGRAMNDKKQSKDSKDIALYNASMSGARTSQLNALYKLYNE